MVRHGQCKLCGQRATMLKCYACGQYFCVDCLNFCDQCRHASCLRCMPIEVIEKENTSKVCHICLKAYKEQ